MLPGSQVLPVFRKEATAEVLPRPFDSEFLGDLPDLLLLLPVFPAQKLRISLAEIALQPVAGPGPLPGLTGPGQLRFPVFRLRSGLHRLQKPGQEVPQAPELFFQILQALSLFPQRLQLSQTFGVF